MKDTETIIHLLKVGLFLLSVLIVLALAILYWLGVLHKKVEKGPTVSVKGLQTTYIPRRDL